jgi:hypothetical protein
MVFASIARFIIPKALKYPFPSFLYKPNKKTIRMYTMNNTYFSSHYDPFFRFLAL